MAQRRMRRQTFIYLGILSVLAGLTLFVLQRLNKKDACANTLSCSESLEFNVNNTQTGLFNGDLVNPPKVDLSLAEESRKVLGSETNTDKKHIYVDLNTQSLKAYQGNDLFMETRISSGKWFPTPTGEFAIWKKIRATKMSGGEGADYYYLPNVPYVMFFSNPQVSAGRGFSLHGTYWHNNFGHAMSHGCVNMRTIDAKKLYEWVNPETRGNDTLSTKDDPGTIITIYGKAP